MSKLPPGADTDSVSLRDANPWLAAEDLLGLTVTAKISAVKLHKSVSLGEGRKEDVYALHFEGKQKALILNKTNIRALKMGLGYGPKATDWIGKTVRMRAEKLKRPAFGRDHGVRIVVPGSEE